MAYKFSDDDKQVKEGGGGNWFGLGVHEVTIGEVKADQTDEGKDFVEFTVLGNNEEEDTVRVWFTSEKAANYSFNVMRQVLVHCVPEASKDKARDAFDATEDNVAAAELLNSKCVGKKCWFTKYPDPKRTYTSQSGEVKQSINKNIYGYEPKARTDLLPKQDNIAEVTGDETNDEIKANIPEEW